MTPRSPSRLRATRAPTRASARAVAILFGLHIALGSVVLAWGPDTTMRWPARSTAKARPTIERLLFVDRPPVPADPAARQPAGSPVLRRASALLNSSPTPSIAPPALRPAAIGDVPTSPTPRPTDDAVAGLRPRLGDARLWAPKEARATARTASTPTRTIDEALARVVDSTALVRGTGRRAAKGWTMTDARGRTWGWDSGGLRLGRVGLDIQPPALTDRERARVAAQADIERFGRMTPGDAEFDRLKAELRLRRERARPPAAPPSKR